MILERYNRSTFAEQELRDTLLREMLAECGEGSIAVCIETNLWWWARCL